MPVWSKSPWVKRTSRRSPGWQPAAWSALTRAARLFLCELHPFRQYLGAAAHFHRGDETVEIPAYVHHVSDFTDAARANGLAPVEIKEWWHPQDEESGPPRLLSAVFERGDG